MSKFDTAIVLNHVAEQLRADGLASVLTDGRLHIGQLSCSLRCEQIAGDFHPMMCALRLLTEHSDFEAPIEDEVTTIGDSPEAQAEQAAGLWMHSFFRPFHWFLHEQSAGEPPLGMLTTGPEGELYGWQVFTTAPASTRFDLPSGRMELMQPLIGSLNTLLVDRKPHTLKSFVMKERGVDEPGKGTGVGASCHFDNQEWIQGLSQLLYLADSWGRLDVPRMRRQWFFFKPATREMLGDSWDRLTASLTSSANTPSKPWWKFWS